MNAKTKTIRILAADDHALLRQGIASLVEIEPDMELVAQAATGRDRAVPTAPAGHNPHGSADAGLSGMEAIIAIRGSVEAFAGLFGATGKD